jgi:hypothetical protein
MSKFILLYNGPATPPEQMNEEKVKAIMAAWTAWMEKAGGAVKDMGQPMDPRKAKAVMDDGSTGTPLQLSGYSIIEAEDLDAAAKLVEDHPFLSDKSGKFSVEVFELLPVPGDSQQ